MERDARVSTDAVMEHVNDPDDLGPGQPSSKFGNPYRTDANGNRNSHGAHVGVHLDDTHTGQEDHAARGDFLRLMRVLMFLSPNGGWASRDSSEYVRRPPMTAQEKRERYKGWRPRSELDISGHSFRKAIKVRD